MKKICCIFFLFFPAFLFSQTAAALFKRMPNELLPGFSEANKILLVSDTAKSTVPYTLGEIKKLEHGDDYLKLSTSDAGTLQLKLLPVAADSVIICLITTICSNNGICDSRVDFYTTFWEKLNSDNHLPQISAENFFDSSQKVSDNYKYAVSLSGIYPISAEGAQNSNDLTLSFDVAPLLSAEQKAEIAPFLKRKHLVLEWREGCFREKK